MTACARLLTVIACVLIAGCSSPAAGEPTGAASAQPMTAAPAPSGPGTSAAATATAAAQLDPATADPCALLDAAAIGEALGESVSDGVRKDVADSSRCFYDVPAWPVSPVSAAAGLDSGVSLRVFLEEKTVATRVVPFGGDTENYECEEVASIGDGAWWCLHKTAPNFIPNEEDVVLDVVAEPFEFHLSFIRIPSSAGVDRAAWLADATALANEVLAALGT